MSFLQSSEWEQIQRAVGRKTWRVGGVLVIEHALPYGFNYLYCPRPDIATIGPDTFLNATQKIAHEERTLFLKIDPITPIRTTNYELRTAVSLQPRVTTVLDLMKPEEALLAGMHKKHRYTIREATAAGVACRRGDGSEKDFETFWQLLQQTASRGKFFPHAKVYYQAMLAVRSPGFSNELFFAESSGQARAVALVNFYKNEATYLHGASSSGGERHSASHVLQWEIMREGKRRGVRAYDLWGIDEKKWSGVSRFKERFGGVVVKYPEAVLVIWRKGMYRLYSAVKFLTK